MIVFYLIPRLLSFTMLAVKLTDTELEDDDKRGQGKREVTPDTVYYQMTQIL